MIQERQACIEAATRRLVDVVNLRVPQLPFGVGVPLGHRVRRRALKYAATLRTSSSTPQVRSADFASSRSPSRALPRTSVRGDGRGDAYSESQCQPRGLTLRRRRHTPYRVKKFPSSPFELVSEYEPQGDQPRAIAALLEGLRRGEQHQTLLGVTGSGKTFTAAQVIAAHGRPALVLAPNKTLAAQLYAEFKALFPENAVEYFVSYYDYYQPEAYIPASDTFIEKDAMINEAIDRMRHSATRSLLSRKDVIIVASVSCIYGIGSQESYKGMVAAFGVGEEYPRDHLLQRLVEMQYQRNDVDFHRGTFRVRGDVVEVFPAYEADVAVRVAFFGDTIDDIAEIDPLRGKVLKKLRAAEIYPGSHYVTPKKMMSKAINLIRDELQVRLTELKERGKLIERERLEQRVLYDLEMLEQVGFCHGIENYSRHLSGRAPGEAPPTLIDYFPPDYLLLIDESHQTVSQVGSNGLRAVP